MGRNKIKVKKSKQHKRRGAWVGRNSNGQGGFWRHRTEKPITIDEHTRSERSTDAEIKNRGGTLKETRKERKEKRDNLERAKARPKAKSNTKSNQSSRSSSSSSRRSGGIP